MKTFAAMDVGSFETAMKIFEFSPKNGMKEITHIRRRLDLGSGTYEAGKISYDKVEEICRVLKEFTEIMKEYRVDAYKAYGTSAIRETKNTMIVLDHIRQKTGITLDVLSNSEQRFLDYKSIASKIQSFQSIIEKGTAVLDIGGSSIQISLFDKDKLAATQNMKLGVLRLRDRLLTLDTKPGKYELLLEEMIQSQLAVFKKLYLKDRNVENIIVVDDYISALVRKNFTGFSGKQMRGYIDSASYGVFVDYLRAHTDEEVAKRFDISREVVPMLFISATLLQLMTKMVGAQFIWAPGVTLCDGIAYEYAEKNRLITMSHDFEQDIVACARNISKRYMGSKRRGETLEKISLTIFDSMKKDHGMGKRERLMLRIAALLHDCGKYISLVNLGECSYEIIMSTEIIGLSHKEREIVANVVKYNHLPFEYDKRGREDSSLDEKAFLTIAKLTAILRVANGLDRSHKQKFKDFQTTIKDDKLILTVNTAADITLEKGLFQPKADFFEEVFSIRPVIKQKKVY